MLISAGAALAVGCSGNGRAGSGATAGNEHLGEPTESNDIDGTDAPTADGETPAGQDQSPPSAGALDEAHADETLTSNWNCFGRNGRFIGRVGIWWGNTATDGTWACNEWRKSECSAAGGCVASGSLVGAADCDVSKRADGCSLPLYDPLWATAMNVAPTRVMFLDSFVKDQIWKDNTCLR